MSLNRPDAQDSKERDEDNRFRLFFENAPLYCYMISPQGIILDVNQSALQALGYSRVELIGKHIRTIYADECQDKVMEIFKRWKENASISDEELIIQNREGHQRTVLLNANMIMDDDGQVLYSISIQKDISERKEIERVLQESELALKKIVEEKSLILDSISEHVIYQDMENRIIWANRAAADSVNLTLDEITGRFCYEVWPGRETPCEGCPIVEARKTGEVKENEMSTPDGRYWFIRGYPLKDEEGNVIGCVEVTRDITERKVSQEALFHERDRGQQYLEIAGAAFIGIDVQQRIFLVNRKACEIFGYTENELIGQNYFDTCITEPNRTAMKEFYEKALTGQCELKEFVENPIIRKDGSERIIQWHTTVLREDDGTMTGILSSGEDVTERKIAEEALKESEEKFRLLVEDTADWVWEVDQEFKFTYSNCSVEDILGYTAGQIIGRELWDLMEPSEIEEVRTTFSERGNQNRSFRSLVNHFFHRDGNTLILETSSRPIFDESNQVIGFRGVCRDITQRMIADDILKQSESRYRALVETSPDAIMVTDAEGNITLVNDRAIKLLGYDAIDELIGKSCFELVIPEDRKRAIKNLESTKETGIAKPEQFTLIHKDGSTFPADISAAILYGAESVPLGYILVARDITERKEAEKELEEAKARAEFFTDLMAHDLNNINQAILSALEIQLYDPDVPEPLREQLQVALEQVERSSALIGRVRKFSRIDATRPHLGVRDIEPDFQSALNAVKQAFPKKTIRVDTNIHPGKYMILADELLLDLFYNLLHNATKFDRREKVEIEVNVSPDDNKRFLRIELTDQGPGISDELKKLIFARFTRRIGEKAQGSGIGLTLVQRIIGRYGGQIWVENRVENDYSKGAKFVFLLPLWK